MSTELDVSKIFLDVTQISSGNGSPESVVTAPVGAYYFQSDSPFDLWRKVTGSGNTGWNNKIAYQDKGNIFSLTQNFTANLLPVTNYTSNIGALSNKFLALHAAELWVETLVAQNTIATIGGRVLVAPTNLLTVDLAAAGTSITVKYNNLANGDRIYMEADGKVEWMAVTSTASGSAGAYVYTVTRNLDGTGANQWYAGDAVLDTGTTGNGFIDLYSVAGVLSGAGPTIVGNVRTGTTYSNISPRWAIGNLDGLYGYSGSTYGAAFGTPSAAWVKIDPTNGVRLGYNTTTFTEIDASGNASFLGSIKVGTAGSISSGASAFGTGTGWWLDYNAGTPRFSVGNPAGDYVQWDGSNLSIQSWNLRVDGSGSGNVGIGSGPISAGRLNVASADDTVSTYSIIASNHSGTPTFITYGDGRTYMSGPLYVSNLPFDTTGAGTNAGLTSNGPFGSGVQPVGWFNVYINGVSSWMPVWQ